MEFSPCFQKKMISLLFLNEREFFPFKRVIQNGIFPLVFRGKFFLSKRRNFLSIQKCHTKWNFPLVSIQKNPYKMEFSLLFSEENDFFTFLNEEKKLAFKNAIQN